LGFGSNACAAAGTGQGYGAEGLPYALSTAVSIFDQPELIALWYLLKWLQWQASEEAIGHVVWGRLWDGQRMSIEWCWRSLSVI